METVHKVGGRVPLLVFLVPPAQLLTVSRGEAEESVSLVVLLVSYLYSLRTPVLLLVQVQPTGHRVSKHPDLHLHGGWLLDFLFLSLPTVVHPSSQVTRCVPVPGTPTVSEIETRVSTVMKKETLPANTLYERVSLLMTGVLTYWFSYTLEILGHECCVYRRLFSYHFSTPFFSAE